MGAKRAIFLSSVIPSHTGCPQARQAFIYLRILRCIADVKTIVLDRSGRQFANRGRLCRDTTLVPLSAKTKQRLKTRHLELPPVTKSDARRIQLAITKWSEGEPSVRVFAEDDFVATIAKHVLPASGKTISIPLQFGQAGDLVQSLTRVLFATHGLEQTEQMTLILSGEERVDHQVCKHASAAAKAIGAASGRAPKVRVLGDLPADFENDDLIEASHWRDLVGLVSTSWLVVNLRAPHQGGALIDSITAALGVPTASPLGFSGNEAASKSDDLIEWSSMKEMAAIIHRYYASSVLTSRSEREARAPALPNILQGLVRTLGERLPLKSFPSTVEGFFLSGAPARRTNPLRQPFQIFFVPATSLLCLRSFFSHKSGVNEIRVLDQERNELGRIVPSLLRPELPMQPIHGGFILHGFDRPPAILLQFFESGLFCGETSIAADEIPCVTSELVALEFSGEAYSRSSGLVWANNADEELELVLPRDARHRLIQSDTSMCSARSHHWRTFSVKGLFAPYKGETVQILSDDVQSFNRPLALGLSHTEHQSDPDPKIQTQKDAHVGRRAWIIGNGPSVKYSDLDRIGEQGDIIFCFNRFHLAYPETTLRDDFVVSADTLMIAYFGD